MPEQFINTTETDGITDNVTNLSFNIDDYTRLLDAKSESGFYTDDFGGKIGEQLNAFNQTVEDLTDMGFSDITGDIDGDDIGINNVITEIAKKLNSGIQDYLEGIISEEDILLTFEGLNPSATTSMLTNIAQEKEVNDKLAASEAFLNFVSGNFDAAKKVKN